MSDGMTNEQLSQLAGYLEGLIPLQGTIGQQEAIRDAIRAIRELRRTRAELAEWRVGMRNRAHPERA